MAFESTRFRNPSAPLNPRSRSQAAWHYRCNVSRAIQAHTSITGQTILVDGGPLKSY